MDPLVYAPRPFKPVAPPPPGRTPDPPQFPPRTFPKVKPFSRVAAPAYETPEDELSMDLPDVAPDPYVGCQLVPGLDATTFWPYINNLDATFVMFYDPCEIMSGLAKIQIRGAAVRTQRPMHKYVAVDCTSEQELCAQLRVCKLPAYQLYSRGSLVNAYKEVESIRAKDMQNFVENTPVIENSTPMACPQ